MAGVVDACLIAGGRYHDIDYVRLELLRHLAEHERVRTRVAEDYARIDAIDAAQMLVTYTCDVVPDDAQIAALQRFLARGGRWLALHGTNSVLRFRDDNRVECPPLPPAFVEMLGSQFMAHPPPGRYKVHVADGAAADHPLIAGIEAFSVEDEHYLQDTLPGNEPLLATRFAGVTSLFVRDAWPDAEHSVMYLRRVGGGEVLYLTLGHARGRYDLRPIADRYPFVERGAWVLPMFHELLRRSIAWALPV